MPACRLDRRLPRSVQSAAARSACRCMVSANPCRCKCTAAALQAPAAERRPKALVAHGHEREDAYYWLRDDDRKDPAVRELGKP